MANFKNINNETSKYPEILAPCSNWEMYEAGKKAGTNAIYIATKKFGARAYAENFTVEEIKTLCEDSHLHDIKVYVTINTLIKDSEISEALKTIEDVYNQGVDGILFQDLGLYSLVKDIKGIEKHASTQLSIYNLEGAKFLTKEGFDRIVIGRETPIEEIKRITDEDIVVEAFIHGSLCVSLSGQCLMSSFIGGRSGNRGACAQPCRKTYKLKSNGKEFIGEFLSPADLNTINRIDDLLKANIDSLKIEGRMKKPSYVYAAVSNYKKAIEKKKIDEDELYLASNRSFTQGYLFNKFANSYINDKSNKGLSVGEIVNIKGIKKIKLYKDVYKGDTLVIETNRSKVNISLTDSYKKGNLVEIEQFQDSKISSQVIKIFSQKLEDKLKEDKVDLIPLDIDLEVNEKKVKIEFSSKGKNIEIIENSEKAKNYPLDDETIIRSMSKLGDTDFYLRNINIKNNNKAFIPVSKLNDLRRRGIDALLRKFIREEEITLDKYELKKVKKEKKFLSLEIYKYDREIINISLVKRVYLHRLEDIKKVYGKVDEIFYIPPKFMYTEDYNILKERIGQYLEYIDGFSCNSISDFEVFKDFNKKIHFEHEKNIMNSYTYRYFKELGVDDMSISQELTMDEIDNLEGNFEGIIYGRLPVMTMRHCPFSSIKKCQGKGCETCPYYKGILISDMGDEYIYKRNYEFSTSYTEIFQKPIESLSIKDNFSDNINILRIIKTDEIDIDPIIKEYYEGYILKKDVKINGQEFLGHYKMGLKI